MILDQALAIYETIHDLMLDIEKLSKGNEHQKLAEKFRLMETEQERAKEMDKAILNLLNEGHLDQDSRVSTLLDRMQKVQVLNQRITPQLQAHIAVQREELKKLRSGSTIMRGYHSNSEDSGRLVSHSG